MEALKTKLKGKTWLVIIIISLFGQVAWAIENNFFNLYIKNVFGANLNQIALMVSLSAIAATLTTLFIGALSDKLGKRKVFIATGYILWGITIICFALLQKFADNLSVVTGTSFTTIGVSLVIIFDCIMTFFGSSANDACFNAWMTDISDETNRGKIEGVNSAMPLLAMLLVFGGAMFLTTDDGLSYKYDILFIIIGITVLVVGIGSFFLIDEPNISPNNEEPYFKNIFYGFRPSVIKENKTLYLVFLSFCIFSIAQQVFMPYYVIYLNLMLGSNYVFIMAPAIVLAAVFTVLYGRLIDKLGFVKGIITPFTLFVVGLILLTSFTNPVVIFIGSLLMISGFLGTNAVHGAMIRDYTPQKKVGLFQGIRIVVAVLIPMLVGPWIGSLVSSGVNAGFGVVGDDYTPSSMIFLAGAIVSLLCIIVIIFISKKLKLKIEIKEDENNEE